MLTVMEALAAPIEKIVYNTGISADVIKERLKDTDINFGYDAKNKIYGDMFKLHVIDPAKVTRLAIESAISVAKIFLTLDCIIIDEVKTK